MRLNLQSSKNSILKAKKQNWQQILITLFKTGQKFAAQAAFV